MADAPDQITKQGSPSRTEAPGRAGAWELPSSERDQPYTPLSLLAVSGLVLSVLYAALIAVGGVAAFASRYPRLVLLLIVLVPLLTLMGAAGAKIRGNRLLSFAGLSLVGLFGVMGVAGLVGFSGTNPWVLPGWTLLFPITAVGLCLAARVRIKAAEGTLAGNNLASWGLALSLLFGLVYAAYMTASTIAVRQQAADFTENWLKLIRNGETVQAFLLSLSPGARPAPNTPNLRSQLEAQFNRPTPPQPGQYSAFSRAMYVRMIQAGGDDTHFELVSISPEFEQNAYRVLCRYQITTPYASFPMTVMALGTETGRAGSAREWQIIPAMSGTPETPIQTAEGKAFIEVANNAGQIMTRFLDAANKQDYETMYRLSLPQAERERIPALAPVALACGLGALGGGPARDYLTHREKFFEGGIVRTGDFWSLDQFRKVAIDKVKGLCRPGTPPGVEVTHNAMEMPTWKREGKRLELRSPISLTIRDPGGPPRFNLEADIVLVTQSTEEKPPPEAWHVEALQLLRAHSVQGPSGPSPKR